ncbi:NUDIX hydrolase [Polaromonas sp. YR568]|uniref:NUDIX hydrolase n=1 Tax=Polaromonas sp. YR568 TaxID=1855301 RepID=UPI00313793E2
MELNLETVTTPPRPAATVVLLRDAPAGLEVFLMKRHGLSDVLGGAYVFPGGKIDAADAELDMAAHLDQPLDRLHAGLNEPGIDLRTAGAVYVAALREAFEESGVLFAQGPALPGLADQAAALLREGHGFNAVLARMALRLQTLNVVPWSRWITPVTPSVTNKRFDARFFVAAVPGGQLASHDNFETTESIWLSPRHALQQYWDRQIELAPPQIMSLAHLSRHAGVESVLAEARGRRPPVIQPEPFEHEGSRVICYPGDARHSVREQALPGPTRLSYRNRRFEPDAGFEALLG